MFVLVVKTGDMVAVVTLALEDQDQRSCRKSGGQMAELCLLPPNAIIFPRRGWKVSTGNNHISDLANICLCRVEAGSLLVSTQNSFIETQLHLLEKSESVKDNFVSQQWVL